MTTFTFDNQNGMGAVYSSLFSGDPSKTSAEVSKTAQKVKTEAENMVRSDFHRVELMKTTWEVPKRYTKLKYIGAGAYGQVCEAYDKDSNTYVAIKKFSNPFFCVTAGKRTYREIKLLKFMDHDNVINLAELFTPALTLDSFHDLYVVMPLMKMDLRRLITEQNYQLNEKTIKLLVNQILRGLRYIHSTDIIHRDLKPGNIAVDEDFDLKILDFGLARTADETQGMTGYVFTRWYRAPEIILNWRKYTKTADIWSVGCIMAEMYTGKVLFRGSDKLDQIDKIIAILGKPNEEFCEKLPDDAKTYVKRLLAPQSPTDYLHKMLRHKNAPDSAISLISQMLEVDPDRRLTAGAALIHPYFDQCEGLFSPSIRPGVSSQIYDSGCDDCDYTEQEWKALVFDEVVNFNPDLLAQERASRQQEQPPFL